MEHLLKFRSDPRPPTLRVLAVAASCCLESSSRPYTWSLLPGSRSALVILPGSLWRPPAESRHPFWCSTHGSHRTATASSRSVPRRTCGLAQTDIDWELSIHHSSCLQVPLGWEPIRASLGRAGNTSVLLCVSGSERGARHVMSAPVAEWLAEGFPGTDAAM